MACGRRCCLCYSLDGDFDVKRGQIAHIDRDKTNSELQNLAYLCLPHHEEYDSMPSQTRRLMPEELANYKEELEQQVERVRADISNSLSDAHAPPAESSELRERDIKTLTRILSVIHTDLLDDFFENGIHGTFLADVSTSYDQFRILTTATAFHIYDPKLNDLTMRFSDDWASCFAYSDYLFTSLSNPHALQFQSPHMVDNPDDVRQAFRGFQSAMLDTGEAFREFISYVLSRYAEIDIASTNTQAIEMIRTSYFDEDC